MNEEKKDPVIQCIDCGKRTSLLETQLRKFNTFRCGFCGGKLYGINRVKR